MRSQSSTYLQTLHQKPTHDLLIILQVLMIGAGPTGLILSQLLKINGASKVVLAANKGMKMDIARKLNAADVYIDLERDDNLAEKQWEGIKKVSGLIQS
jgi:threonine dehydrogenase-like Zn-dependent dehydrogenase